MTQLNGHSDRISSVAISSDNKYIISGSYDETVIVWDRESGEVKKKLKEHLGCVYSVVISSDNKYIVSGSNDKTIRVWERESS